MSAVDREAIVSFVRHYIPCNCGGWSERFDGVNVLGGVDIRTVDTSPTGVTLHGRENHVRSCSALALVDERHLIRRLRAEVERLTAENEQICEDVEDIERFARQQAIRSHADNMHEERRWLDLLIQAERIRSAPTPEAAP
jgi:hypothetical protein